MIKKLLIILMIFASLSAVSCNGDDKPKKPDPITPEKPEKPEVPTLPKELAKEWKLIWAQTYNADDKAWRAKQFITTEQSITLKMDSTVSISITEDKNNLYKNWRTAGDTLYLAGGTEPETPFKYVVKDNVLTATRLDGLSKIRLRDKAIAAVLDPLLFGSWLLDSIKVYDPKGVITEDMKAEFRQTMNIKSSGDYVTPRIWGTDSITYKWQSDANVFYLSIPEEPTTIYDYEVVTRNGERVLYQTEYLFDAETKAYTGYQVYKFDAYVLPAVVGTWDLLHIQPYLNGKPAGESETPDVIFRQFFSADGGNTVTDLSSGEEFYGFWTVKGDQLTLMPEGEWGQPDEENASQLRYKVEGEKLYMFAPVPPGEGYDEVANVYVRATVTE